MFMFTKNSTWAASVIVGLVGFSSLGSAAQAASVINGGFETGDFTGWTVVQQNNSDGDFFITGGGRSPDSRSRIPTPSEGENYAVTDQFGPGSYVLSQDIILEANSSHQLSFDWFAQTESSFANPGTMDFRGPENQQFRVDIVEAGFSDWFGSDSNVGVLANIVPPVIEGSPIFRFNSTTFDLTSWAGSTVRLAFRQVDNRGHFQAGVDNVSITSTPTQSVPEPLTILGSVTALGIGGLLKRKQSQKHKKS